MKRIVRLAFALLCLSAALYGQTGRGSLTGTVADASGAGVPAASVVVTSVETGAQRRVQSSATGVYAVAELPFGAYHVTVAKEGFQTAEARDVLVAVNQVSRLDVALVVGAMQQSVEVRAASPLLQQDDTTVQTSYDTRFMAELPLALGAFSVRSPEAFTFLTPGVVGSAWVGSSNGGQTWANSVLLDGASAGRSWHPGNFDESAPSVEALGQFSIKTNAFSAEYGRSGSSITSFAYKSGGNAPHGSVYGFLRNEALDARGFYHTNTLDRKQDYGFTFSGPVRLPRLYNGRDRTFFFFSFEAFLTDLQYTAQPLRVPSELQKQGDFSELLKIRNPVQIYNPRDGTAFVGNLIPRSQWSKVSTYALPFLPKANMIEPGTGLMRYYQQGQPTDLQNNLETIVLDHRIVDGHQFHYSHSRRNNHRFRDPANMLPRDNPLTMFREQTYTTGQWRASLDSVLSPALLNHLNLGFDRVKSDNNTVSRGMGFVEASGLNNVMKTHTPTQNVAGYSTLGNGEANTYYDNRYEIVDNLTWVRGKHAWKFGGDLRRTRLNISGLDNSSGVFNFDAIQTGRVGAGGGDGFASWLLGAPSTGYKRDAVVTPGWRSLYVAMFVQDDWKASSRLTVNLGLRWEVDFPRSEVANRYSGLDPVLPNPRAGGIPGALRFATADQRHFDNTSWKGFGPRAGLAYTLSKRTVIRTGYGIYYNLIYYDFGNASMRHGFEAAPTFSSPDGRAPAFYWDNGFPDNYAKPPFTDPSGVNGSNIDYTSNTTRPPYIQSWNFGIERQATSRLVLSAFYVGNKGTRLNRNFNMQQTTPENLALGELLTKRVDDPAVVAAGIKSPYPTFLQDWPGGVVFRALRPFPQYNVINWINSSIGNSTYNSLQLKAEQRFHHGLQFMVNYTWSKNLTDAETAYKVAAGGFTPYQNDRLGHLEKSVSTTDRTHIFNVSFLYELPVGKRKPLRVSGWVAALAGDWQITGASRYLTGPPVSLYANCPSITQVAAGRCRPVYTGVAALYGPGKDDMDPNNGKPYFNAEAFAIPLPYRYGDTDRNMAKLRTPAVGLGENLGLMKRARIGERVTAQIRAEAFNAFNRVIFAAPDATIGGYAANRPGNITRNQSFGFVSGQGNTPRVVQLALKFLF